MARYSTTAQLDIDWIEEWARKVNEDGVLKVIGRFFNATFVIGIDDRDYLIVVRDGSIQKITDGLTPSMMGWQFALRASSNSWSKFAQPIPPPMFNDIWAMALPMHGKLKIEGDTKPFWQNLRALTWMLAIMREV